MAQDGPHELLTLLIAFVFAGIAISLIAVVWR